MIKNGLLQAPKEWVWERLGSISEKIVDGSHNPPPKRDSGIPMLSAQNVFNAQIEFSSCRYVSVEDFRRESLRAPIEPGDVLLTIVGTIGRSAVVKESTPTFTAQRSVAVIRSGLYSHYLSYLFQSPAYFIYFKDNAKGTAQKGIYLNQLRETPIPVPPLAEQRRIVAKIEELFTKLDAGVASLKAAKAQLKRYRQAVLKAAVEGELTREWREKHKDELEPASALLERILRERREKWEADQRAKMRAQGKAPKDEKWKEKYQEPVVPGKSNLPGLPKEWQWAFTQQLGEVQLGRQRSPKNRSKDYPTKYIRAANITEKGLDLNDILDMEFEPHELERYLLRNGDILLSEASGSPSQVGKPAVWREQLPECCFQNTVIRLRPNSIPSEYLLLVFRSYYANGIFSKIAAGVGINHLSADKFSALTVPLPPLAEQQQIVSEVERRLSVADEIEASLDAELKRAERLRQSILKRAFEGKLVPQDPNDEPASILLERMKAERSEFRLQAGSRRGKSPRKRGTPNGGV